MENLTKPTNSSKIEKANSQETGGKTMERIGKAERKTKEVDIEVAINLDTPGEYEISIASRGEEPNVDQKTLTLFHHFYQQIYHHGFLSGFIKADGDLPHHVLEDLAMVWGEALRNAVGDRRGIMRFGSLYVPFDGSLAFVSIDYSGRGYAVLDFNEIEDIGLRAMAQHTFEPIAKEAHFNLYGFAKTVGTLRDDHHKLEAFCKAFGRVLHPVTRIYEPGKEVIPSTKGV